MIRWSVAIAVAFVILLIVFVFSYSNTTCTVLERVPYHDGTIIEVVTDTCSEGLPHTRNRDTIVMPAGAWNDSRREETLRHEMVHIRQRKNIDKWYRFYRDSWDYVPVSLPPELSAADIRPNPDTADSPFMLWRNTWLFLPYYTKDRTLRNAEVRVYNVRTKEFVKIPPEWTAFFSADIFQKEHPHEIAAELLTNRRNCTACFKLYDFMKGNQ